VELHGAGAGFTEDGLAIGAAPATEVASSAPASTIEAIANRVGLVTM